MPIELEEMLLEWFILLVLFVASVIYLINMGNSSNKALEKFQEWLKQKDVSRGNSKNLIHLSGHPYLGTNETVALCITNHNTIFFCHRRPKEYSEKLEGPEIPISDLTRYEVKTETEIQRDVTLTRLVALGIFAFALKKEKKVEEQFLILSYNQSGVEVTCVFKQAHISVHLGGIISTLNRMKIESTGTGKITTPQF